MLRRIKWCLVLLCLLLLVGRGMAAESDDALPKQPAEQTTAPQDPPAAKIAETTFDFGDVMEGAEVSADFMIKNSGKGELRIDQVRPSCGCTAAHFDRSIPPGGEGKITLKLNLKGYSGAIKKTTSVFTNDPQNPRYTLTMQGNARAIIDIRPSTQIAFRGMAQQLTEQTVELAGMVKPFQIQKLESNLEEKIAYQLETAEAGKLYRIKVTNKVKQGTYNGFIKVFTDLPDKSDLMIRVSGYIEGEISVKPQVILIGKLDNQQPVRVARISVISNRGKPFKIEKLTYDTQYISIDQQPLPKDAGYSLEITPNLSAIAPGGRQQTRLTIDTDVEGDQPQDVQIHIVNSVESVSPPASALPPAAATQKPGASPAKEPAKTQ